MMRLSIRAVRNHVAALRLALLAPSSEELQRFLPVLADAAGCLSVIQRELGLRPNQGDPELGRELKALKQDLRAVGKLIEHGAAFWQAWAKRFGAATGGYTPSGEPRPVAAAGTISVRG
jgi:hypothetical protein